MNRPVFVRDPNRQPLWKERPLHRKQPTPPAVVVLAATDVVDEMIEVMGQEGFDIDSWFIFSQLFDYLGDASRRPENFSLDFNRMRTHMHVKNPASEQLIQNVCRSACAQLDRQMTDLQLQAPDGNRPYIFDKLMGRDIVLCHMPF